MKSTRSLQVALMAAIAALSIIADQTTKWWVATRMVSGQIWAPFPALEPYFTITYVTNSGIAFGQLKGWGPAFAGVALVAIIAILFYQRHVPDGQWLMRVALGLQLGGASGNLINRLFLRGEVIDFLDFKIWPVFNVADGSLVVGAVLMILVMMREPRTIPPLESMLETQSNNQVTE
ncbi:MAG: signal peptidase II [Thermoflexales bacterium]|nr:signal peptidase II [Thermoflexales bacterium]